MPFPGLEPPEVIHLFVALACFSTGAITFAMAPRSAAHVFFAFFTALLGAHFASILLFNLDVEPVGFWWRATLVTLVLDPLILLYFTALFPRRRTLRLAGPLAAAFAVIVVLEAYAVLDPKALHEYGMTPPRLLLAAYMATMYVTALVLLTRNLVREESHLKREQLVLMTTAFGIALIPRLALIPMEVGLAQQWVPYQWWAITSLAWALFAAAALWVRREARRARAPLRFHFLTYMALGVAAITLPWLAAWDVVAAYDTASAFRVFLASTQFPLRWIVFLIVVGYALLKYEAFDSTLRLKRAPAAALTLLIAASALVGTFFYVQVFLDPLILGPTVNVARVAAAAVALLTLGLLLFAGPEALRRRGPFRREEDAALRARRLEVYRNSLEDAVAEGRRIRDDPGLAEMRARLNISEAEHAAMSHVLTAPRGAHRQREPLAVGVMLYDRYEITAPLGRGRSGRTFHARDRLTGTEVAIKEIVPGPAHGGADGSAADEVVRELAAAARVRDPHVVHVHEVLQDGSGALVVMEYAPGGNLAQHLVRHAPLPPARVLRLVDDLLAGLSAVHAAGLVHRDVKPANVLLFGDERAKLTDFGVAHVPGLDETRTAFDATALQPGTLRYMAPEQAVGSAPPSPATDVYAVGVILYEAITDRPYLDLRGRSEWGVRAAIANEHPSLPLKGVSDELNAALARALRKDARERFPDAAAFRDALARCPEAPDLLRVEDE